MRLKKFAPVVTCHLTAVTKAAFKALHWAHPTYHVTSPPDVISPLTTGLFVVEPHNKLLPSCKTLARAVHVEGHVFTLLHHCCGWSGLQHQSWVFFLIFVGFFYSGVLIDYVVKVRPILSSPFPPLPHYIPTSAPTQYVKVWRLRFSVDQLKGNNFRKCFHQML